MVGVIAEDARLALVPHAPPANAAANGADAAADPAALHITIFDGGQLSLPLLAHADPDAVTVKYVELDLPKCMTLPDVSKLNFRYQVTPALSPEPHIVSPL